MTNKEKRYFNIAREISFLGDFDRVHIGAIVVEGNRIISTGYNSNKTSPLQQKYNRYRNFVDGCRSQPKIHAEIAAIAPLLHRNNVNWCNVSIYVYRELADGTRGCSRPCAACMRLIQELGIKRIYYIGKNGEFIKEETLN